MSDAALKAELAAVFEKERLSLDSSLLPINVAVQEANKTGPPAPGPPAPGPPPPGPPAPAPAPWLLLRSQTYPDEHFYFNPTTQEACWELPNGMCIEATGL